MGWVNVYFDIDRETANPNQTTVLNRTKYTLAVFTCKIVMYAWNSNSKVVDIRLVEFHFFLY